MKTLFTIAFLLINVHIYCQSIPGCGLDSTPLLNVEESQFLQRYLQPVAGDFDFSNKKVAFVEGPAGRNLSDKMQYFKKIEERLDDSKVVSMVIPLTPEEKEASGGYDAIITSWVKVFSKRSKKKVIKKLSKS